MSAAYSVKRNLEPWFTFFLEKSHAQPGVAVGPEAQRAFDTEAPNRCVGEPVLGHHVAGRDADGIAGGGNTAG